MSQTPFSSDGPSPWSAQSVDPLHQGSGAKTVLVVLLAIGFGIVTLVAALGGLVYFGMQRAVEPELRVTLPERSESAADASTLAAALQQPAASAHPQSAEIRTWFVDRVARSQRGESIAPKADLFFAAVNASPEADELNLLQQIQLRTSLEAGCPEPLVYANHTILEIAEGSVPDSVQISFIFYDADSLASLQTWYLIQVDQEWELYDWFEADLGRRKSDEYAHYCRQLFTEDVDGFDTAERLVYDASNATSSGNTKKARSLLKHAERVATLPYDRDRGLLSIGRGYQTLGDDEKAAEVFQRARNPNSVPGIWASLGVSQIALELPEAALESADRLRAIYPGHPAGELIAAYAHERLNQQSEAADAYLRCLVRCPNDTTVFDLLILQTGPKHASQIVQAIRRSDIPESFLLQWFAQIEGDAEMIAAVDAALGSETDIPAPWKVMSEALLRHAKDDVPGAVEILNQNLAASPPAEDAGGLLDSQRHWMVRWSLNSGELAVLREREDFESLMQEAATLVFADEYYPDSVSLETTFAELPESLQETPGIVAMRGWAAWQENRFEDAANHLAKWLDAHPAPAAGERVGDTPEEATKPAAGDADPFLHGEIPWYLNQSLASAGRFEEALLRFGDNLALCWDATEMLIQRHDPELARPVREQMAEHRMGASEMVCAAIDASLAAGEGDADEADRRWVDCLKAFGEIDSESYSSDSFAFDSAARSRGRTAVRLHNVHSVLDDRGAPGWTLTVQEICHRTANLADAELAAVVTAALHGTDGSRPTDDQAVLMAVREMNADIAESRHDWKTAIGLRRSLMGSADIGSWEIDRRRTALIRVLLAAGNLDEDTVHQQFEDLGEDSFWATYYAARGMEDELRDRLSKLDSQQRGEWYMSPENRSSIMHDQALAEWISQSESPIAISHVERIESMFLVEERAEPLSSEEVESAASMAFGTGGSVSKITTGLPASVEARWAIRVPDSIDILVTQGRGKVETGAAIPTRVAKDIADAGRYIAVDVLRSVRPKYEASMALASQLASETTRLVYSDDSSYVWCRSEEPWSERLAFQDCLPTDAHSLIVDYLYVSTAVDDPSTAESSETITVDWLVEKLAAASDGFPLLLQISGGRSGEQLPAIAKSYDPKTTLVELELRENSSVLPALQKGQRVRAHLYHLTHP